MSQELTVKGQGSIDVYKVKEGDCVKPGDIILELDHRLLKAGLKEAKAGVDAAQSQLNLAEDGYKRLQKIKNSDGVSEQQLVESSIKVSQARASLNQAKASKERVSIQLSDAVIKAKIKGTVIGLPTVLGLYVQPGTSLGRIEPRKDCQ